MAKSSRLTPPPLKRGRLGGGARFTLIAALSLDGRITAGNKEGSEWTSREDKKFFQAEMDRADAVIMGRKTFDAIKHPLKPRNRIVFSRSLSLPSFPRRGLRGGGPFLFNGSPKELHALLHEKHWSRIAVVGGTQIYDWFLKCGLVDEIYLTLEPIVFGSGKTLSTQYFTHFRRFKLASIKKLNTAGTLLLHYKTEIAI